MSEYVKANKDKLLLILKEMHGEALLCGFISYCRQGCEQCPFSWRNKFNEVELLNWITDKGE